MFVALVIKHAMCMCHIAYLRTVRLYMFVLPYLINGAILWKYGLYNACWVFLYKLVWNISHSKKAWARYRRKSILVFVKISLYICHVVRKLEFPRHIFENFSNTNFLNIRSECAWNCYVILVSVLIRVLSKLHQYTTALFDKVCLIVYYIVLIKCF